MTVDNKLRRELSHVYKNISLLSLHTVLWNVVVLQFNFSQTIEIHRYDITIEMGTCLYANYSYSNFFVVTLMRSCVYVLEQNFSSFWGTKIN